MIIHKADSRGEADHGWLKSRHTFSFADYHNNDRMNFGVLRVLNDDSIASGKGFGTHPHRDMEIISVPINGVLEHKDSEGNQHRIKKGEIQTMSAGTGIFHSEYNASSTEAAQFLQIWVLPKKRGIKPQYGQKKFDYKKNLKTLLISPDGREESIAINQDAFFTMVCSSSSFEFEYSQYQNQNGIYLFIISGEIIVNGEKFYTRDGIALSELETLKINSDNPSEFLLMEIPMKL